MSVHPGDLIRWRGEEHHVVLVRSSYLTLRPSDGDDDIEVLAADLQAEAEPASAKSTSEVLDLRVLKDLDRADRRTVDVWLDELDRFDQLIADSTSTSAATRLIIDNVNRRLGTDYSPRKVQRQHQALREIGVSGLLDRRRFGLAEAPARSYDSRLVDAFTEVIEADIMPRWPVVRCPIANPVEHPKNVPPDDPGVLIAAPPNQYGSR